MDEATSFVTDNLCDLINEIKPVSDFSSDQEFEQEVRQAACQGRMPNFDVAWDEAGY